MDDESFSGSKCSMGTSKQPLHHFKLILSEAFFCLFLAAFLACLLLFFTNEISHVIVLFVFQFLLKLFKRALSKVFIISNNETSGPALIILV
jgi:hypothetical protein